MIVLVLVVVCVTLIYRYTTRNQDYWSKRNVKHDRPLPFFGNHLKNFLVRRTVPGIGVEFYNKYKGEKVVGYYRGTAPELIIRDPEIVRHILSADFKNFSTRGGIENPVKEPLLHNLLFMNGEEWRFTRQKLAPGFSNSRLRNMFPLVLECVEKLDSTVEHFASQKDDVSGYELMAAYTLECIGSCCFGVELNTISHVSSNFTHLAKRFFAKTKPQMLAIVVAELLPQISKLYPYKIVDKDLESEIIELTRQVRRKRNSKPSGRNDFMDILLEMEVQRKLDNDKPGKGKDEKIFEDQEKQELENIEYAAAQLFIFLVGGFETSATAISTTLHQLAYHPETQIKIQAEIDQVLSEYDNKLTYECLAKLTQLDMAIKESMRLLAPFGSFRRVSARRYTIPGINVTIDPGVRVLIPVQGLQMDPEYFEDPEKFRPERFSPEAVKQRPNFTYMVFGEGPRKCIGNKLALMMVSAGLATILRRYTVVPAPSSNYRLGIKSTSYLAQIVEGGIPVRFEMRKR